MSKFVLDASAILAVLNSERGSEKVESILEGSWTSAVNVAEVLSKLSERGTPVDSALYQLLELGITFVDFDLEMSATCAQLRPMTRHLGLSLGDRACLALAIREKATALTADKAWAQLEVCPIEVIR